jgi:pimeloyl-ACP methyl ester carboxylesterase
MTRSTKTIPALSLLAVLITGGVSHVSAQDSPAPARPGTEASAVQMHYKTAKVMDLDIFYREAGPKDAPMLLLLHGFPTSSQMFRNLIPSLADKYHVVAPDYPGYGHSSMPSRDQFAYTFDNLAAVMDAFTENVGLTRYALYVQDYGAPIGYRLAVKHPERITAIIVQNGNAYDEGLDNDFWKPIKAYWKEPTSSERRDALRKLLTYDATRWQYTVGVKDPELVSPDGAAHDQFLMDRPGNVGCRLRRGRVSAEANTPAEQSLTLLSAQHAHHALIDPGGQRNSATPSSSVVIGSGQWPVTSRKVTPLPGNFMRLLPASPVLSTTAIAPECSASPLQVQATHWG